MNKKILLVAIIIILIGGVLLGFFLYNKNSNMDIGEFKLSDYQSFLDKFPSDKSVIEIENAVVAREQAEKIWIGIYGNNIKDRKPYSVLFDETNGVWLIQGSLPKNWDGGVPHILIKTDGKILAVWHDK